MKVSTEIEIDQALYDWVTAYLCLNPGQDRNTVISRALAYYLLSQGIDCADLLVQTYPQKRSA